jgi:hypothetical protein
MLVHEEVVKCLQCKMKQANSSVLLLLLLLCLNVCSAAGEEGSDDVARTPKGAIDKCMELVRYAATSSPACSVLLNLK